MAAVSGVVVAAVWVWTALALASVFTGAPDARDRTSGLAIAYIPRGSDEAAVSRALSLPAGGSARVPSPFRVIYGPRGSGKTTLVRRSLDGRSAALYVPSATAEGLELALGDALPSAAETANSSARLERALEVLAAAARAHRRFRFERAVLVVDGVSSGSSSADVVERLKRFASSLAADQVMMTVFVVDSDALSLFFTDAGPEAFTHVGDLSKDTTAAMLPWLKLSGEDSTKLAELTGGRLGLLSEFAALRRKGPLLVSQFESTLRARAEAAVAALRLDDGDDGRPCRVWKVVMALVDSHSGRLPQSSLEAALASDEQQSLVESGVLDQQEAGGLGLQLEFAFATPSIRSHMLAITGAEGSDKRAAFLDHLHGLGC
eukprot:m51a1_g695 hypothetical protein (376) ;mRNA; r:363876-365485